MALLKVIDIQKKKWRACLSTSRVNRHGGGCCILFFFRFSLEELYAPPEKLT